MPHHVAVGALVGPQGVLLAHRRPDLRYFPDCWDFPGGHLEGDENAAAALVRELQEEIGCVVEAGDSPRLRLRDAEESPDGTVLDLWVLTDWLGEPSNLAVEEHDDLQWVIAADLPTLRLAHPAYGPLLAELTAGR